MFDFSRENRSLLANWWRNIDKTILSLNDEIICINDSKATNFESSSQSLMSYKNIFWIVGGIPKKGDKFGLNKFKKNIIKAYIIGKSTVFFKKQLRKKINFVVVNNLNNAVLQVIKDLKQINSINNLTKKKYGRYALIISLF